MELKGAETIKLKSVFGIFGKWVLVLVVLFGGMNFLSKWGIKQPDSILGTQVTVTAEVAMQPIIIVKPQNRIPPTGNDSLQIDVEIRNPSTTTSVHSENLTVDNTGTGYLQVLSTSAIPVGPYDIAVKGLSHLRRVFTSQTVGPNASFILDLRFLPLLAGDSHPTADNYVNSLDISYEILNLYSGDLRADLNRDSKVNSLEFPTLISNLYKHGDI